MQKERYCFLLDKRFYASGPRNDSRQCIVLPPPLMAIGNESLLSRKAKKVMGVSSFRVFNPWVNLKTSNQLHRRLYGSKEINILKTTCEIFFYKKDCYLLAFSLNFSQKEKLIML